MYELNLNFVIWKMKCVMEDKIISYDSVDIMNGKNLVLSDVTFSVEKGEFVYVIGKVGSGKTSLLMTMIGDIPVTGREAVVVGNDLLTLKQRRIPFLRRCIGVVFQDFQLLMDRDVYENLSFVLKATGWSDRRAIDERIKIALRAVGMDTKAHKMPFQLSGGEQQRVAIARAILNDPKLILADEPTGNLDLGTAYGIMDVLHDINRQMGSAVVMVTHNMDICRKYPARTLVCENLSIHGVDDSPREIDLVI